MADIIEVARVMRPRSCAKTLAGTCKEMLGTAQSVGCTIDHQHPQAVMAKVSISNARGPNSDPNTMSEQCVLQQQHRTAFPQKRHQQHSAGMAVALLSMLCGQVLQSGSSASAMIPAALLLSAIFAYLRGYVLSMLSRLSVDKCRTDHTVLLMSAESSMAAAAVVP